MRVLLERSRVESIVGEEQSGEYCWTGAGLKVLLERSRVDSIVGEEQG